MFIIFDLDDTLIDTSGCITPLKLERALHKVVENGALIDPFERALEQLLRLDRKSDSARSALEEFFEINELDTRLLPLALEEVYHSFSDEIPVFPFEDTLEELFHLSLQHQMAIVTVGNPNHQLWKLKKAGIDSSFFCKIIVLEEKNKKKSYQALLEELNCSPKEVVVCGDRISIDLAPAKQLGCMTVHMKRGRGLYQVGQDHLVDYTITCLSQMREILGAVNNKVSF